MNCPIDGTTLAITERQGVEIDYCPHCRGVWLDRGELDKLIDKSDADYDRSTPPQFREPDHRPPSYDKPYREDHRDRHYDGHYKKKRRESFLGDIFDF
jgi:uncharacterized protein